jgi:hypothetical protein
VKHGRRDGPHAAIRDGLRAVGASVRDTADLGDDFPDLVVGFRKATYLLEVKRPGGEFRKGQALAAATWRGGPWIKVESLDEALAVIGLRLPSPARAQR